METLNIPTGAKKKLENKLEDDECKLVKSSSRKFEKSESVPRMKFQQKLQMIDLTDKGDDRKAVVKIAA